MIRKKILGRAIIFNIVNIDKCHNLYDMPYALLLFKGWFLLPLRVFGVYSVVVVVAIVVVVALII